MLKRLTALAIGMVLVALSGVAVHAHDDIMAHRECHQCGMDRKVYGYSRMLIVYEGGAEVGVCSLHCAVTEMDGHREKKVTTLLVADRDSHALIPADTASWVIGGRRRGVMTQRPKWAFATIDAARAFVASNGGAIVRWDEALAAAREDALPKPGR
ncbi:MAG TPA: nitrous oxide reductase accessory protein NosL [Desulfuromonadaceae bacterium]